MKPVILLDVDGVLLHWQTFAVEFCNDNYLCSKLAEMLQVRDVFVNPFQINGFAIKDLIVKYNESEYMNHLNGYKDAISFVEKYKDNFDLVAVTAMSNKKECLDRRQRNLDQVFGVGAIKSLLGCEVGASKAHCFELLRMDLDGEVVAFVDDVAHNIEDAIKVFPRARMFHLVRDVRENAKVPCHMVSNMNQIDLEDLK